jgi:dihydroflavonol-4-reductase
VTGANGHLGNVVCRKLLEQGYAVRAMYHSDKRSLQDTDVELVEGDILQINDVSRLIQDCEAVIHCAGIISINGDPDGRVFLTNTEGPRKVLQASKDARVKRIIHISSVHAVNEIPHHQPFHESRPYKTKIDPVYDYSKATGEQIFLNGCSNSSTEIIVLRPSSIVGPYDFKPSLLGAALIDFYKGKIPFLPQGGYDFVDVRDVAQSAINAIHMGKDGEVYNLTGTYYNFKKFAKVIQKVTGKKVPQRVIPYKLLKAMLPLVSLYARWTRTLPAITKESIDAVYFGHPQMDHSKAKKELHFTCRALEESLQDYYQWQKQRGKI